jgi:hypothetical protein
VAEQLGFNDIMLGGGTPSFAFDETTYNTDRQRAIDSAIAKAIQDEIERDRNYTAPTLKGTSFSKSDLGSAGTLAL